MYKDTNADKVLIFRRIIRYGGKFIDYPMAAAGALIMGLIVWFINFDHGAGEATVAALKQALYTFLFGGILIKLLYKIVLRISNFILSLTLSVASVSTLTIALVFLLHCIKGTPKPFLSTLPTILLAPPGFFAIAYRKKKLLSKEPSKK